MSLAIPESNVRFISGLEFAGEPLLLPGDIIDLYEKYAKIKEAITNGDVRISRMVATPLVADRGGRPNMDMIDHPLMWLGERQTSALIDDETGEKETTSHWALRVAIELQTSNIYTPGVGWVDVLSLLGLDKEEDAERLNAWIAGGADELLDTFTLSEWLDNPVDPGLSFDLATSMERDLRDVSIGLVATSLERTAREALTAPDTDEDVEWTTASRRSLVQMLATLGAALLGSDETSLEPYAAMISGDVDPTMAGSSSWAFVEACSKLSDVYGKSEAAFIEEFESTYGLSLSGDGVVDGLD